MQLRSPPRTGCITAVFLARLRPVVNRHVTIRGFPWGNIVDIARSTSAPAEVIVLTSTLEREATSITNAEELTEATRRDGVEFLFAMFVDMHGKPCAKMVPVSAIEGLLADGAGFAGFAAGPMGQTPSSPDILAMPDLDSYMPAPWRPGLGIIQCDPYVLGRAVAVRPSRHPAPAAGASGGGWLCAQGGSRGGVLPGAAKRRWHHCGRRSTRTAPQRLATTPER